jgi:hypothetical protein
MQTRRVATPVTLVLAAVLSLLAVGCMGDDDESSSKAVLVATSTTGDQEVFENLDEDVAELPVAPADLPTPRDSPEPAFGDPAFVPAEEPVDEGLKPLPQPKANDNAAWGNLSKKVKTSKDEMLPVIVVLKADVRPEGKLKKAERDAQQKGIKEKQNAVLDRIRPKKVKNVKTFDQVPVLAVHVSADALAELRKSPDVAAVSEDRELALPEPEPGAPTPEPQGGAPAGVSSNQSLADWWDLNQIQTLTSNNNGYDGRGWHVAVLDTGVQANHQGLSGKVVNEACFSTPNGCPNGTATQYGAGAAQPCTYASACAHGTHVAHTAAGYWGVARAAKVIGVQVFHRVVAPNCPQNQSVCAIYYESDVLKGMQHIWNIRGWYNIAAVNLSLGDGTKYLTYCDAGGYSFNYWAYWLRSVGIATVVASGNDSFQDGIASPACNSNAISVGNTTLNTSNQDAVFVSSNHDDILSVLAPGTHICSAVPSGWACGWTGTSMAAPHVAGAIAILKQLRYWASVTSEVAALQNSGTPVTGPLSVSKPRIRVWDAVVYLYNH